MGISSVVISINKDNILDNIPGAEKMDNEVLIIKSILNGETQLFSKIVDRYYSPVMAYIMRMGITKEDAEDIVQEVLIKVYNNLYKFNEKSKFSTWIFKIAINTLKDFKKKKRVLTQEIDEKVLPSSNVSPQDDYIEREHQKEMVKKLFGSLKLDVKTAMILHFVNELSYEEVGKAMGISAEAVAMKIYRARKSISQKR